MDRHRIVAPGTANPLVVESKRAQLVLDDLDRDTAAHWHHRLTARREPHAWQATDGGSTGWNSVSAYLPAALVPA